MKKNIFLLIFLFVNFFLQSMPYKELTENYRAQIRDYCYEMFTVSTNLTFDSTKVYNSQFTQKHNDWETEENNILLELNDKRIELDQLADEVNEYKASMSIDEKTHKLNKKIISEFGDLINFLDNNAKSSKQNLINQLTNFKTIHILSASIETDIVNSNLTNNEIFNYLFETVKDSIIKIDKKKYFNMLDSLKADKLQHLNKDDNSREIEFIENVFKESRTKRHATALIIKKTNPSSFFGQDNKKLIHTISMIIQVNKQTSNTRSNLQSHNIPIKIFTDINNLFPQENIENVKIEKIKEELQILKSDFKKKQESINDFNISNIEGVNQKLANLENMFSKIKEIQTKIGDRQNENSDITIRISDLKNDIRKAKSDITKKQKQEEKLVQKYINNRKEYVEHIVFSADITVQNNETNKEAFQNYFDNKFTKEYGTQLSNIIEEKKIVSNYEITDLDPFQAKIIKYDITLNPTNFVFHIYLPVKIFLTPNKEIIYPSEANYYFSSDLNKKLYIPINDNIKIGTFSAINTHLDKLNEKDSIWRLPRKDEIEKILNEESIVEELTKVGSFFWTQNKVTTGSMLTEYLVYNFENSKFTKYPHEWQAYYFFVKKEAN